MEGHVLHFGSEGGSFLQEGFFFVKIKLVGNFGEGEIFENSSWILAPAFWTYVDFVDFLVFSSHLPF